MEQNQKYTDIKNAVESYQDVTLVKNGFFKSLMGNKTTMTYSPTGAKLKRFSKTFAADNYDAAIALVSKGTIPASIPLTEDFTGNVRIECYASSDNAFCALQLWRFIDFEYAPVTSTYYYTAPQAPTVIDTLTR